MGKQHGTASDTGGGGQKKVEIIPAWNAVSAGAVLGIGKVCVVEEEEEEEEEEDEEKKNKKRAKSSAVNTDRVKKM